jgi:hypothetical protein
MHICTGKTLPLFTGDFVEAAILFYGPDALHDIEPAIQRFVTAPEVEPRIKHF